MTNLGFCSFIKKPQHLFTMFIVSLALFGCQDTQLNDVPVITSSPELAAVPFRNYTVGLSVEKRPIECVVMGSGEDVTFVLGGIHGDEQTGIPIARRLAQHLQQQPLILRNRKIVLMPVANPDGVVYNWRFNARGVDLNRNFHAANRVNKPRYGHKPLSEPEAQAIHWVINQYSPDRIVTLHQPLNCVDYDGPAEHLARHMAKHCDLPVKKLGARPGSLGSYAGETLGIPIITVEFGKDDSKLDPEVLWDRYARMIIAAIEYPQDVTLSKL